MHLIIFGATGLVGSAVLQVAIQKPEVTRISIVGRRDVPQAEGVEKVSVYQHQDFENYDEGVLQHFKDAKGVVWALGISQNAVSRKDYINITKTYPIAFAKALLKIGGTTPKNFVLVSGEGATLEPNMLTPLFGRVKGETEKSILATAASSNGHMNAYSLRPGMVDPLNQPDIHKWIPQAGAVLKAQRAVFGPLARNCWKTMLSPTKELGEVLVQLALGDGKPLEDRGIEEGGRIITNIGMRKLAGL